MLLVRSGLRGYNARCRFRHPHYEHQTGTPPPPVRQSVGLLFLYGALDSHPFFPSHVASGRCVLSPPRPPTHGGGVHLDARGQRRGQLPSAVWTRHRAVKPGKARGLRWHTLPRARTVVQGGTDRARRGRAQGGERLIGPASGRQRYIQASFHTPLWDTDACARPVPSGTKQKCKAKVKEKSSSVTCHRHLSRKKNRHSTPPPPPHTATESWWVLAHCFCKTSEGRPPKYTEREPPAAPEGKHGGGVATGHTPTPPHSRTTFRAGGGGESASRVRSRRPPRETQSTIRQHTGAGPNLRTAPGRPPVHWTLQLPNELWVP